MIIVAVLCETMVVGEFFQLFRGWWEGMIVSTDAQKVSFFCNIAHKIRFFLFHVRETYVSFKKTRNMFLFCKNYHLSLSTPTVCIAPIAPAITIYRSSGLN
jgi:hypothetical protein